jgi:hypothetical protein
VARRADRVDLMLVEAVDRRVRHDRRSRPRGTPDRRGRKPHEPMTFARFAQLGEDVARGESRNLTLRQISDLSGISVDKLLSISDYLGAFKHPKLDRYEISHADAARFLRELRLIP